MAALSLLEVLADVPDPRSRLGRRHPLAALLALTVLAMLRGCNGPTAVAQFAAEEKAKERRLTCHAARTSSSGGR